MADLHDHLSCQEIVELVSDYVEGALDSHETALFEQHLNSCEGCVTYVEQVRAAVALAGRVPAVEDVPPATMNQLMVAFRDWRRA